MPKMKAPADVCSFSHNGQSYEVNDGIVEVDAGAVADALVHGFALLTEEDEAAAEAEAAPKATKKK